MSTRTVVCRLAALLTLVLSASLATACGSDPVPQGASPQVEMPPAESPAVDPLATAAAQATAIVQQAQATAMILQAESMAQATVQAAARSVAAQQPAAAASENAAPGPSTAATLPPPTEALAEIPIEVLGVGFAADGGMIEVRFRAPVDVADRWLQTDVYLIDEGTGAEYREIPVMPRIGPLFGKPVRDGQPGYFMLVNAPVPLQPGATVTVVLKDHIEEGIKVQ